MHLRLILAAALAVGLSSAAQAQTAFVVPTCGALTTPVGPGGVLTRLPTGELCTSGGGSGGGGGTVTQGPAATDTSANRWPVLAYQGGTWNVGLTGTLPSFAATPTFNLGTLNGAATAANQNSTAAGTSAGSAQGVQGVTNGVPVPVSSPDTRSSGTLNLTSTANVLTIPVPQGAATFTYNATGITGSGAVIAVNGSVDGSLYTGTVATTRTNSGTANAGTTSDVTGSRSINVQGLQTLQVAVTTAGTGSATVSYTFSTAATPLGGVYVSGGNGGVTSISRIPVSLASVNLQQAKSGPGRAYKIIACNTTTTPARIKFYNALSSNVTVGTTAPFLTRPIPAAALAGGLFCAAYDMADIGWYFSTAISYALVTGAADNDNTAVAAGAITDVSVEVQ